MSYTPTNWTNGDIITTEKLNKIENGIVAASSGGGGLKVGETMTVSESNMIYTLDKTYKQIVDAVNGGIIPYAYMGDTESAIIYVLKEYYHNTAEYCVVFGDATYATTSENGYPSYTRSGK